MESDVVVGRFVVLLAHVFFWLDLKETFAMFSSMSDRHIAFLLVPFERAPWNLQIEMKCVCDTS